MATVAWLWVAFIVFILFLLALDVGVFHRRAHTITLREALLMSGLWVGVSLVFAVFVYFAFERHWFGLDLAGSEPDGRTAAILYLTGYAVEKSLGVDNGLRHRDGLFVLRDSVPLSASGAVLGHRRRPRHARRDDRGRRGAPGALRMAALRVRDLPDRGRHSHGGGPP
jgi:hypothetical protein